MTPYLLGTTYVNRRVFIKKVPVISQSFSRSQCSAISIRRSTATVAGTVVGLDFRLDPSGWE